MTGAKRPRPLRVLISAGPTREPIDPARFLSNYSTGFMGICLATEAIRRGHRVTLVSGPMAFRPPRRARVVWVEQAHQMQAALRWHLPKADVLIMAAAVCDFQPARPSRQKLSRQGARTLALKATPDIVGALPRRSGQLVVGFALETHRARERALAKLRAKRLDFIVAQELPARSRSPVPTRVLGGSRGQAGINGSASPFGRRPVKAFFLDSSGAATRLGKVSKAALARAILDKIEGLWYGRTGQRAQAGFRELNRRRGQRWKASKSLLASR
jgi:hypothetical protein